MILVLGAGFLAAFFFNVSCQKTSTETEAPQASTTEGSGCLLWSQTLAVCQAQRVTQQMEIPLSCMSSLAALLSISSLLPQSTPYCCSVLEEDKSHGCDQTLSALSCGTWAAPQLQPTAVQSLRPRGLGWLLAAMLHLSCTTTFLPGPRTRAHKRCQRWAARVRVSQPRVWRN